MDKNELGRYLNTTLRELNYDRATGITRGKVRDIIDCGDEMLICSTDRISAFDRVLSTIPCKGQVLNELSLFWFQETASIIRNHILEQISPRTVRVAKCEILPVEIVVRGYLTGSAWRDYQQGKAISGIVLAPNLRFNQQFDHPLLTPSTKAERGTHDLPISSEEIVSSGLVERKIWEQVAETALQLYQKGSEISLRHGLILVDTKYEFGLYDNQLYVVDEMHTPDSSRYWYRETYADLYAKGEKQRELDKEYLRQWLIAQGYMGDGEPPLIPDDIRLETALRYVTAYETITVKKFVPAAIDEKKEIELIKSALVRAGRG